MINIFTKKFVYKLCRLLQFTAVNA